MGCWGGGGGGEEGHGEKNAVSTGIADGVCGGWGVGEEGHGKKYKVSTGIADQTLHSAGTLPWSWAVSWRINTSHKNTKATLKCCYEVLSYVGT